MALRQHRMCTVSRLGGHHAACVRRQVYPWSLSIYRLGESHSSYLFIQLIHTQIAETEGCYTADKQWYVYLWAHSQRGFIKGCRDTAVFHGCTFVHLSDHSAFTYYRGLKRKPGNHHNDSTGDDCISTDGVWHACVYCRCVSVARATGRPSPSENGGERPFSVYTVNGQELCVAEPLLLYRTY